MSSLALIDRQDNSTRCTLKKLDQVAYDRARYAGLIYGPYQTRGATCLDPLQGKLDRGKLTLTRVGVNDNARAAVKELRSNKLRMRSQDYAGGSKIKFLQGIEDACQKSAMTQRQQSLGEPNPRRLAGGENEWSDISQEDYPGWAFLVSSSLEVGTSCSTTLVTKTRRPLRNAEHCSLIRLHAVRRLWYQIPTQRRQTHEINTPHHGSHRFLGRIFPFRQPGLRSGQGRGKGQGRGQGQGSASRKKRLFSFRGSGIHFHGRSCQTGRSALQLHFDV